MIEFKNILDLLVKRGDTMTYLETDRLILRTFTEKDINDLHLLLNDVSVNTFLPWYPHTILSKTWAFYEKTIKHQPYYLAICLKGNNCPIGYVKAEMNDSHDFGYALRKEFWHKGIVTEASKSLVSLLKKEGIPYITATHDVENYRSGNVMKQIGMTYCYSYKEQWQPKNVLITFRMYQLNLDGHADRVYKKYWDTYPDHFIEDI
ncbi:GNAT family N-acetyltransferase [Enterococcus faecalis]|nr:GNAT family N-acetyltransferase [Enterococcus faecalis]EKK0978603.1 GNAT family N-acetyltransferase [Enterococcus faecalis]EKZ0163953.1 GNAT family N-acetyltransferase [Enterococcus faecalis]EKZ0221268.1 GNAT family N-acetyltransferase [Enterococcus faecalis]MDN3147648.1 GNAT family N-acetyltransferase [Enterococcus faecalis]